MGVRKGGKKDGKGRLSMVEVTTNKSSGRIIIGIEIPSSVVTEKSDFIIDGQRVKGVVRKDSRGEIIGMMYRLKKGESGIMPHIVISKPNESHLDIFEDGDKIDENRLIKPKRPVGVVWNQKTDGMHWLPPIVEINPKNVLQSKYEIAREYVRRVRLDS
ncbi:hypothetical protein HYU13_04285 [Candidatus Woesearchaeota archaeon]|nr:hypothetical protein [Candidatus Woesearchaeota archaeon]